MKDTVTINPKLLTWARERAGVTIFSLAKKFPHLAEWESGEAFPTLNQLENFAKAVHIPFGYLFMPEPMVENLPVADFRTIHDHAAAHPSSELLDTLYLCQQRQDWYHDYARINACPALKYVGSLTTSSDTFLAAQNIRHTLAFPLEEQQTLSDWETAMRKLVGKVEEAGILVMSRAIVGGNSHRPLRVEEFRGFALADTLAPLVFINGADSKAAQMFTLAHEMAHIWLGESGVSNSETRQFPPQDIEQWCNAVAAEFLMPLEQTREAYRKEFPIVDEMFRLAKLFKVSTLVVLRRLFDAGFLDKEQLWKLYHTELARFDALSQHHGGGGNFHLSLGSRTSKRFVRALLTSTLEGQTLFQDAFRLLCIKKSNTLFQAARELGISS